MYLRRGVSVLRRQQLPILIQGPNDHIAPGSDISPAAVLKTPVPILLLPRKRKLILVLFLSDLICVGGRHVSLNVDKAMYFDFLPIIRERYASAQPETKPFARFFNWTKLAIHWVNVLIRSRVAALPYRLLPLGTADGGCYLWFRGGEGVKLIVVGFCLAPRPSLGLGEGILLFRKRVVQRVYQYPFCVHQFLWSEEHLMRRHSVLLLFYDKAANFIDSSNKSSKGGQGRRK